ncbi:MAG: sigma-70 family RNA polymerase sigma factor [Lachnospiraceae bacterium]|nr:sigma-70 family RNA polymerase sigma factor [Lachnospiraceae bacterium]
MKTPADLVTKVKLLQSQDSAAFNGIYEESYRYLHTCVIHIVKNEDAAQDMLQETYAEIFKNIGQLKQPEDFLSWAATIANRKCFAYIKKNRDVLTDDMTDDEGNEKDFFDSIKDDDSVIPENIFDDRAKIDIIRGIIDGLSDIQRACVIGFYYNEQKQDEIAAELGIPVNTVKSHLNRAKTKIKEAVGDVEKKQGIKLYSFAPFMLLLFAHEAKAYAMPVPAMGAELSRAVSSGTGTGGTGTAAAGRTAGGFAAKKIMIAAAAGLVVAGGIGAAVILGRAKHTAPAEDAAVSESAQEAEKEESIVPETKTDTGASSQAAADDTAVSAASDEAGEETGPTKICDLKEMGYDNVGNAFAGVLIVEKGGSFGAVDYEMNEIVPCKYEKFTSANNRGYFVMFDGSEYILFDKTGKEIYRTAHTISATGNCFIVAPNSGVDDWTSDELLDYYDYSGNLIIETSMSEATPVDHTGSHDGVVLLRRFTEDEGSNHCKMEVGKLYEDGSITWQSEYDGPGGGTEYVEDNPDSDWTGSGASGWVYIPRPLLSGLNGGYYVTYHPVIEWGYMVMYDENSNKVTDFDVCYMGADGSYAESNFNESNDIKGYFYDGAYNYNRGTRMVWTCSDKYILVDVVEKKALAIYDHISLAEDDIYLVQDGNKWGYIDPDGNELAMYDDAGAFSNGYAPIIKDGHAWLIDKDLNAVGDLGEADQVYTLGELYGVGKDDAITIFRK